MAGTMARAKNVLGGPLKVLFLSHCCKVEVLAEHLSFIHPGHNALIVLGKVYSNSPPISEKLYVVLCSPSCAINSSSKVILQN
jgi:hypothetical protein